MVAKSSKGVPGVEWGFQRILPDPLTKFSCTRLIFLRFQGQRPPPGAVVHAQFDAGARFDRNAPPSLPPPPPGVAPTPAQVLLPP